MNQVKRWFALFCYGKVSRGFYKANKQLFREVNWHTTKVVCFLGFLLCTYLGFSMLGEAAQPEKAGVFAFAAVFSAGSYCICNYRIKKDSIGVSICYWIEFIGLYSLFTYVEISEFPQRPVMMVFLLVTISTMLYADMPILMLILAALANGTFLLLLSIFGQPNIMQLHISIRKGAVFMLILLVLMYYIRNLQFIHMQAKIKYQLKEETDELTGLLKQDYAESICRLYLEEKPEEERCVLLQIQIDELDAIKEVYGESLQEDALRTMGQVLKGTFRERDILARLDNDCFLACMKAVGNEKIVTRRANEICIRFRQQMHEIGIDNGSCSIGVCISSYEVTDYEKMLQKASQVLDEVSDSDDYIGIIKMEKISRKKIGQGGNQDEELS